MPKLCLPCPGFLNLISGHPLPRGVASWIPRQGYASRKAEHAKLWVLNSDQVLRTAGLPKGSRVDQTTHFKARRVAWRGKPRIASAAQE
jgi:hypothetical protein